MAIGKEGNVKWVDGFRGVGSALVVLTHLARSWDDDLFSAASSEDAAPRLLQLPYLRILIQGRVGVSIFAFVTGYVCALKPIKLFKLGQQEAAFASVSKSALRRIPRLFLPATVATCLSALACELGLYSVAKHTTSWWIDFFSPMPSAAVGPLLRRVGFNLWATWTVSLNEYDQNQWSMLPLVKGSIWVYAFILATAYVKPRYRMMMALMWWVYFWNASDSTGMQFFWGVLIADLSQAETAALFISRRPAASAILSALLCFAGLTLASMPESHWEWQPWSQQLADALTPIAPSDADLPRFASGLGLECVTLGVLFSPFLQKLLSSKYLLFLGRMSFAVYLLHAMMIKITLCWMLYGFQAPADVPDDNGNMTMARLPAPSMVALFAWQIVWLPMLYGIAYLWMGYVDPWCERVTNKLAEWVRLEASEKEPVLPIH